MTPAIAELFLYPVNFEKSDTEKNIST